MEKIKFKDLDIWLKIPVVVMWIFGIIETVAFLIGFFAELLSYV